MNIRGITKWQRTLSFIEKFSGYNKFEYAIKVSKNNCGYNSEQKLFTMPFYFIPFVARNLVYGIMKIQ